jgi:hypothetical protein
MWTIFFDIFCLLAFCKLGHDKGIGIGSAVSPVHLA